MSNELKLYLIGNNAIDFDLLLYKKEDNNRSQLPDGAIPKAIVNWVIEQCILWQCISFLILQDPYPQSGGLHGNVSWRS